MDEPRDLLTAFLAFLALAFVLAVAANAEARTTPVTGPDGTCGADPAPVQSSPGAGPADDGVSWDALVRLAADDCGAPGYSVPPSYLVRLLDLELAYGVPSELRGMTLAAACHESRFAARAIAGTKRGDGGRARGIIQAHPWWGRVYGLDAPDACGVGYHDPETLLGAWLDRIAYSAVARARGVGCRRPWLAGWSFVAAGPGGWRCRAPRHWTILRGWLRTLGVRSRGA